MKYPFTPWSTYVPLSCDRSCATMSQSGGANGVWLKSKFPIIHCMLTFLNWFETVLACPVLILLLVIPYPIDSSETWDYICIILMENCSSMFEFFVLPLFFCECLLVVFDISILLLRFLLLICLKTHCQFYVVLDWCPHVSVCYEFLWNPLVGVLSSFIWLMLLVSIRSCIRIFHYNYTHWGETGRSNSGIIQYYLNWFWPFHGR